MMATMNAKNLMLSPAVSDLGLGDQLTAQMQDLVSQRKNKPVQAQQGVVDTLLNGNTAPAAAPIQVQGAANMLFGGISLV